MAKRHVYVISVALISWLAALGYTEYTERKPWSVENGSVHLSACSGTHEKCVLEGRIHRGWSSDTYVLTTPKGVEHEFTWNDISSMSHPVTGLDDSK